MEQLVKLLIDKIDAMDQSIREIKASQATLIANQEMFLKKQNSFERRLDSFEKRMDSVETRLDSVERRLDSVEKNLNSIDNRSEERHKEIMDQLTLLHRDTDINWDVTNLNKREIERIKKHLNAVAL